MSEDALKILVNNLSLRDYVYVTKDISDLEIEIKKLKNEIYQLNLDKNELMKTGFECCDKVRNKYKSRIDKAIEYIKEHQNEDGDYSTSYEPYLIGTNKLLEILRGKNNEDNRFIK